MTHRPTTEKTQARPHDAAVGPFDPWLSLAEGTLRRGPEVIRRAAHDQRPSTEATCSYFGCCSLSSCYKQARRSASESGAATGASEGYIASGNARAPTASSRRREAGDSAATDGTGAADHQNHLPTLRTSHALGSDLKREAEADTLRRAATAAARCKSAETCRAVARLPMIADEAVDRGRMGTSPRTMRGATSAELGLGLRPRETGRRQLLGESVLPAFAGSFRGRLTGSRRRDERGSHSRGLAALAAGANPVEFIASNGKARYGTSERVQFPQPTFSLVAVGGGVAAGRFSTQQSRAAGYGGRPAARGAGDKKQTSGRRSESWKDSAGSPATAISVVSQDAGSVNPGD